MVGDQRPMNVTYSRIVLPEPMTTRPGCSGMWTCCGSPPRVAPSKTRLFAPSVVPFFHHDAALQDATWTDRRPALDYAKRTD